MRAWERKLVTLIHEHTDGDDFLPCIEKLCAEYTVKPQHVSKFLLYILEEAKRLAKE